MKKHNTIYKITNLINEKFYIGQHSTNDLDDGYMGSGIYLKRAFDKYGVENFKKEILHNFDNFNDMNNKEIEIINEEFVKRKDNYNIILGGCYDYNIEIPIKTKNHKSCGKIKTIDKNGIVKHTDKKDPKLLNGELVGVTKGKIVVIDKNGNTFNVDTHDERYLNGSLKGITSGKKLVKDKDKNVFWVDKDDRRLLNGELKRGTKNALNRYKRRNGLK